MSMVRFGPNIGNQRPEAPVSVMNETELRFTADPSPANESPPTQPDGVLRRFDLLDQALQLIHPSAFCGRSPP